VIRNRWYELVSTSRPFKGGLYDMGFSLETCAAIVL
jgi:hypothetical protein